ncbi:MAG: hypothetical protein ACYC5V_01990 [Gemmatimonadaceae bacterium]
MAPMPTTVAALLAMPPMRFVLTEGGMHDATRAAMREQVVTMAADLALALETYRIVQSTAPEQLLVLYLRTVSAYHTPGDTCSTERAWRSDGISDVLADKDARVRMFVTAFTAFYSPRRAAGRTGEPTGDASAEEAA